MSLLEFALFFGYSIVLGVSVFIMRHYAAPLSSEKIESTAGSMRGSTMSFVEFVFICSYLMMLGVFILIVQLEHMRHVLENAMQKTKQTIQDADDDSEAEEFDPRKEEYTMTENPMFSHDVSVQEAKED